MRGILREIAVDMAITLVATIVAAGFIAWAVGVL